jgi:hypothetical protein
MRFRTRGSGSDASCSRRSRSSAWVRGGNLNGAEVMLGVDDRPRQLTVRSERDGNEGVRFSVQDVGVGLSEQTDKIFDAFYTTKKSGMGIGLSVSRTIVESHAGRLWVTPTGSGTPGATVRRIHDSHRAAVSTEQRAPDSVEPAESGRPAGEAEQSFVVRTIEPPQSADLSRET